MVVMLHHSSCSDSFLAQKASAATSQNPVFHAIASDPVRLANFAAAAQQGGAMPQILAYGDGPNRCIAT